MSLLQPNELPDHLSIATPIELDSSTALGGLLLGFTFNVVSRETFIAKNLSLLQRLYNNPEDVKWLVLYPGGARLSPKHGPTLDHLGIIWNQHDD